MPKLKIAVFFLVLLVLFSMIAPPLRSQQRRGDDEERATTALTKPTSIFDRGIAFMDAGVMQVNGVENYGMIGRRGFPYCKHGFWGEVRWIIPFLAVPPQPWATAIVTEEGDVVDRSQYYNVLESITCYFCEPEQDTNYPDWEARDKSRTELMGDDTWSDRPLIATSTRPNSWPQGYFDKDPSSPTYGEFVETPGKRNWPGYWAIDPDPLSPTYGQQIPGEFVSDKDIFFIMDDKWNGIRQGDEINVGYPIGFDVEVSGYSYSAKVYEDIVFFNFNLIYRDKNTIKDKSRQVYDGPIDSLYFGFFIDPDLPGRDPQGYTMDPWAEDDYCIADTVRNIFMMFDKDGYDRDADDINSEGPVSAYAIAFLKTPKDVGLTGFHFFDQYDFDAEDRGQNVERLMYAMASGKKELLTPQQQQKYFHGDDPNFDDLQLLRDFQESSLPGERPDPWFMMTSGPFSISPGDTLPLHFCIVGGWDEPGPLDADGFPTNPYEVRFADVLKNYNLAMDLYNMNFRGTGPPRRPKLSAVGTKVLDENDIPVVYTENGKVTLYWDSSAEESVDILTKEKDFEGYKIYKAYFDRDLDYVDWGQEIYEITENGKIGAVLTYVPVFQCDKIDEYEGFDPLRPWFYLGNNSGIVHSWTDEDVVNGVRYRYSITAYDHYYDDPELLLNANESSRGTTPHESNVVDVIPGVRPVGYIPARIDTSFERIAGVGNGIIQLQVIDDNEVTGNTYTLSFSDTSGTLEYSVFDETEQKFKVTGYSHIVNETSGDEPEPFPFFDGVGIKIVNFDKVEVLDEETRWTTVTADTSDYQISVLGSATAVPADYEIRFTAEGDTTAIGSKVVPFQVWKVSVTPPEQIDLVITPPVGEYKSGEQVKLFEFESPESSRRIFTWIFKIEWGPDTVVVGTDTTVVTAYGEAGKAPSVGDVFTITTKKPFTNDVFRFRTYPPTTAPIEKDDLDLIKVVPNPYVVSSRTELYTGNSQWNLHEVRFIHLPPRCTINIYTISGDLVRKLEHDSISYGEERWDLLTKENLETSYGVYIYVVKTPEGKTKIGKLAVVK